MSKLRYLKDEYVDVPDDIQKILNDVFMEGGKAYRTGGWQKILNDVFMGGGKAYRTGGWHSDWEHTIATAYLKLSQRLSKAQKPTQRKGER